MSPESPSPSKAPSKDRGGRKQQFAKLSDADWSSVWAWIIHESKNENEFDAASIRVRVDDAALSSGWFRDLSYFDLTRAQIRQTISELRAFLTKVEKFYDEATTFFGEPDDGKEPFDPCPNRQLLPQLKELSVEVRRRLRHHQKTLIDLPRDPPNTAKPERDLWMARLLVTWRDACHLQVKNSKQLRGFMLAAMHPYFGFVLTERMVEQFLERWLKGKILEPKESILQRLRREKGWPKTEIDD